MHMDGVKIRNIILDGLYLAGAELIIAAGSVRCQASLLFW